MTDSEQTKSTSPESRVAKDHTKPTAKQPPTQTFPSIEPPRPNYPAWIAAFATVGMLIATGVNVWINKLQGDTMEASLQAAQTAANAAKSAALTAADTLKNSQKDKRPYLITETPQFVEPLTAGKKGKANITFSNIGRTPAIKQRMLLDLLPYRVQERRDQFVSFLEGAFTDLRKREKDRGEFAELARKDVAPGAKPFSTAETPSILSAKEIQQIHDSSLVLFYIGIIQYTDAYDEQHETEFCYFSLGKDPRVWHICDSHNIIK